MLNNHQKTKVDLVEDDPVILESFFCLLEDSNEFSPGFSCSTVEQAKDNLTNGTSRVLLLDLGLPDGNGLEVLEFIRKKKLLTDVIIISSFSNEKSILKALSSGAVGFIHKDEEYQEITVSIKQMIQGGSPISPGIARYLLNNFSIESSSKEEKFSCNEGIKLTPREREILLKVSKGYTSKEISDMDNVSYHTVATHIRNIYKKLSVNSRAEALFEAYNMGLL